MGASLQIAAIPVAREAGIVAAALAVTGAFVARDPRLRAGAVLAALVVTPALLGASVWESDQVEALRDRPLVAALAVVAALVVVGGLAGVLQRHPSLLPPLCLGALPFRLPIEAGGESANLLVPLYLILGAGALGYAVERLGGRKPYRLAPREGEPAAVELGLLALVVLYALQSAYSTDVDKALQNVAFFYVPFALLLKLLAGADWTRETLLRCLGVTVALALVFAGVGFYEYGARELLVNPNAIEPNKFGPFFRVSSLFFDPNIYGRFLAIVMLALAAILLFARRPRHVAAAAAALLVLWAGLVLTFSQSSFAALLVGLAVLGILRWRPPPRLIAGAAAAVLLLAGGLAVSGLIGLDVGSGRSLERASGGRTDLLGGGLSMFADRPLHGFGSGSFEERYREREKVGSERALAASHTSPVTIAAEQGLPGLALYALVLVMALRLLLGGLGGIAERSPPAELVARAILAATFCALVFHTLTYSAFLEDPLVWSVVGIAAGLSPSHAGGSAARRPPGVRRRGREPAPGARA